MELDTNPQTQEKQVPFKKANPNFVKQFKNWQKLYKLHKSISAESLELVDLQIRDTLPYKLVIKWIQEIQCVQQDKSKNEDGQDCIYFLKLYINFYSKHIGKFFGRTYISQNIKLNRLENGNLEVSNPISLYYHTNLDLKKNPIIIIEAEIQRVSKISNMVLDQQSMGWLDVEVSAYIEGMSDQAEDKGKVVNFKKGSARALFNEANLKVKFDMLETKLCYLLHQYQPLLQIQHILPPNTIVGFDDILPGIIGRNLPNSIQDITFSLEKTRRIFINSIQVLVSVELEQELIDLSIKLASFQFGELSAKNITAKIVQRRFNAFYHNGWSAVNTRGFDNFSLLTPGKTQEMLVFGLPKQFKTLMYNGVLDVEGIFFDPYCILIVELEYVLQVQHPKLLAQGTKDLIHLPLAWYPLFIDEQQDNVRISEELYKGPGCSLKENRRFIELTPYHKFFFMAQITTQELRLPTYEQAADNTQLFQQTMQSDFYHTRQMQQLQYERQMEKEEYQAKIAQMEGKNRMLFEQQSQSRLLDETTKLQLTEYQQRIDKQLFMQTEAQKAELEKLKKEQKELLNKKDDEFHQIKSLLVTLTGDSATKQKELEKIKQKQDELKTDRVLMEKWKVIDAIQSVTSKAFQSNSNKKNQKAFASTPWYGIKEVKEIDKQFLRANGICGLLDDSNVLNDNVDGGAKWKGSSGISIKKENVNEASIFCIQFMAIRPFLMQIANGNGNKAQTSKQQKFDTNKNMEKLSMNENYHIPEKVYFTLNFFDHPLLKSDVVQITNPYGTKKSRKEHNGLLVLKKLLQTTSSEADLHLNDDQQERGQPESKNEDRAILYKFEIDTNDPLKAALFRIFSQYLYKKQLIIDIWDADTLFQYGSVKVPLRSMLRQGQELSSACAEYDIFECNPSLDNINQGTQRIKGSLVLSMQNFGKPASLKQMGSFFSQTMGAQLTQNQNQKTISDMAVMTHLTHQKKQKIVSQMPMQFPNKKELGLSAESLQRIQSDPERRKLERIRLHKMQFLQSHIQGISKDKENEEMVQQCFLEQVAQIRDEQKDKLVKQIVTEHMTEQKRLFVQFGEAQAVPYELCNAANKTCTYSICIEDPDMLDEFTLITNDTEYEYFLHQCKEEAAENMPNYNNINFTHQFVSIACITSKQTVTLKAGERILLLFKYLCFRDTLWGDEQTNIYNARSFVQTRTISVFFEPIIQAQKQSGGDVQQPINTNVVSPTVSSGFSVKVTPQHQMVDGVIRYYESENQMVSLILPKLHYELEHNKRQPLLHLTYPMSSIQWLDDETATLEVRTPASGHLLCFNLLVYSNPHFSQRTHNYLIELHSLCALSLQADMGQLHKTRLAIQGDRARICRMYTDAPLQVWCPPPFDRSFPLSQNKANVVVVNVRSYNEHQQKVRINCVDADERELVQSWIYSIDTKPPTVTKIYQLQATVGNKLKSKFVYQNKLAQESLFEFISSQPDILKIIDSNVDIKANQAKNISIKLPKRHNQGTQNVLIFVTDHDLKINECLLFKITYQMNESALNQLKTLIQNQNDESDSDQSDQSESALAQLRARIKNQKEESQSDQIQ